MYPSSWRNWSGRCDQPMDSERQTLLRDLSRFAGFVRRLRRGKSIRTSSFFRSGEAVFASRRNQNSPYGLERRGLEAFGSGPHASGLGGRRPVLFCPQLPSMRRGQEAGGHEDLLRISFHKRHIPQQLFRHSISSRKKSVERFAIIQELS